MILVLPLILIGVFAYLYWKHRATTLSRNCRWRRYRAQGIWRCAYCGAELGGLATPRVCLRLDDRGREEPD